MNSNCDADGQRVRKDDPNGTTAYAGPGFEQNAYTGVQRATYSFNGQVVAVRNGATTAWFIRIILGQASLATDYTGVPWLEAKPATPRGARCARVVWARLPTMGLLRRGGPVTVPFP